MLNTIKYTIVQMVRIPSLMVWMLAFPIVLSSMFVLMFSAIDEEESFDAIDVVVVEPQTSEDEAFSAFIDAVSTGDERIFNVKNAESEDEAERMVLDSQSQEEPFVGYIALLDGVPQLHLAEASSNTDVSSIENSVAAQVLDDYAAKAELVASMLATNPQALYDEKVTASLFGSTDAVDRVYLTHMQPKESVRYYFALLGMAALFGASASLLAFQQLKPNMSALGARRAIGAKSRASEVIATLLACWAVCFACLVVAFLYIRFVAGVEFAGREGFCLLVMLFSSLFAVSIGCAISAIPKIPDSAQMGIITGIACISALFAGLYGQPTMDLANTIAANVPAIEWINPASQIAQSCYSVMYYDSLVPLFMHLGVLLLWSVLLLAISIGSLRRRQYASI